MLWWRGVSCWRRVGSLGGCDCWCLLDGGRAEGWVVCDGLDCRIGGVVCYGAASIEVY